MPFSIVEENLRVAMRCYARVSDKGEARDYPGITVSFCGLCSSVFNSAMLTAPAEQMDLRRRIALAGVHFQQRQVGWTLWLCDDLLSLETRRLLRSLISQAGMKSIAQPPGMYAERLDAPRRFARDLTIRCVDSDVTRLDFAHLSSVIFALPFQTAKAIYGAAELWASPMTGWIGYVNDQAVSLAAVVIGAGAAGVYSVGTLPAYQGRGYAETLIRYALGKAREVTGNEATVLQSTAQGFSLYSRMGYRTVTRFGVYLNESWQKN